MNHLSKDNYINLQIQDDMLHQLIEIISWIKYEEQITKDDTVNALWKVIQDHLLDFTFYRNETY
ncbi:hypothetical protein [Lysinibacillus xylanilyticus]|uniref:Uncharacterized protein n=1 Tax=Lysinibacillus xylanilyticus TaxID=582475 RepID=A0ABT4EWE3_9BACI|nr:hypothetical protein [Lysinibacillus xylanilyticus]MCY9549863.1 hypothetical protein [Lysinibacillus xylanilyticus]